LKKIVAILRAELFGECLEITGVDGDVIIEPWMVNCRKVLRPCLLVDVSFCIKMDGDMRT
jgi:hypothetical protein